MCTSSVRVKVSQNRQKKNKCQMEACRRSRDQNGQPKSFPGTLSVYQFIPLSAQSWGMLIMRRAGGAIEITLQRWGLYYVQRASQFNACCSELWLITPGCCSTPEVHLWNVLKRTAHSPVQYTDLCCWEMNTGAPFFHTVSWKYCLSAAPSGLLAAALLQVTSTL